jgi:hypothetical protein
LLDCLMPMFTFVWLRLVFSWLFFLEERLCAHIQ